MNDWLSRLARMLLFGLSLVPQPAPAAEDPFCDYLLLLDRLPGHARRLLAPRFPPSAMSAYQADLARVAGWLDQARLAAVTEGDAVGRAMDLHRHFLGLIKGGDVATASRLIGSQGWRLVDAWVNDQMRLRDCIAVPPYRHPKAAQTLPDVPPVLKDGPVAAPSRDWVAVIWMQDTLPFTVGLVGLLAAAGTVAGGGWLLFHRFFRREAVRLPCFITGALQGHLYCEATEIVDISRLGCKLRLHDQLDPDRPLTLFFGNVTIEARAIWSNSHYAGLQFAEALTPARLRGILDQDGRPPDGNGPPVPSLPCHDKTCRSVCLKYRVMQDEKNRMGKARVHRRPVLRGAGTVALPDDPA